MNLSGKKFWVFMALFKYMSIFSAMAFRIHSVFEELCEVQNEMDKEEET